MHWLRQCPAAGTAASVYTDVLSLAKLAGTDQRYYLDQAGARVDHTTSVSSGAEDYYLAGPEATGSWTGSAALLLGLPSEVTEQALRSVLSRHDPSTGRLLEGSVQRARVPGFDFMFSVPKSASVLFGIGDPATQRAVLAAQAAAVAAALRYLEANACRARRGAGGFEIVPGAGFVGASFRHRTSRAGDPQVHTHVLVANATRLHDGTWAALDGRAVYAEARTAGFVHEAVFRRELRERLGVTWTAPQNGISEIEGVPRSVTRAFSRRRAEIDAQVSEWGCDTAAARQSAAVQTRKRKDYDVTPDQLAPEWRARAAALGLDEKRVARITGKDLSPITPTLDRGLIEHLCSSAGLTERQTSFDRRDIIRAAAEHARDGATLDELEAFADRLVRSADLVPLTEPGATLRREDVIRRSDGRLVSAVAATPRWTTTELLAVEQRVIGVALASAHKGAGVVDPAYADAALARRPSVGDDQASMVRRLTGDGAGVQVVVGPPGTGKTFALAAAREAWEASGYRVIGASVARRAAVELTSSAGIEATSVAALMMELRRDASLLDDRTVLVVDEAGMLGTRPLAELVDRVMGSGAKLVLVGDPEQLPEIDAGGTFRALAARTAAIQLETNRRQTRACDRILLNSWRSGDVRAAMSIAVASGDLILAVSPEAAVGQLVQDYRHAVDRGEDAVMLAPRRAEVRHLNALARQASIDAGIVAEPGLPVADAEFAVGDRVVLRSNAPSLRIENGTRGTVVGVDSDRGGELTIELHDGSRRTLPSRYLHLRTRSGGPAIEHGYAMTAHLAQGLTTDRTLVLGSESVYKEWGYTAWSRSRLGTRFYAVEPEVSEEHHTAAPSGVDRFDETVRRLEREGGQHVASESVSTVRAVVAKHAPADYLTTAIGPRPDGFRNARRWDRAAAYIERYRTQHRIADSRLALGPEPASRPNRLAWRRAQRELDQHRRRLGLDRAGPIRDRSLVGSS